MGRGTGILVEPSPIGKGKAYSDHAIVTIVLAHLAARATKGDATARFHHKLALTRGCMSEDCPNNR